MDNAPVYRYCLNATPYYLLNTVLPQRRRMKIIITIAIIVTESDPDCSKHLMSDENTDIVIHHYPLRHIQPITGARRTGFGHNTCPTTRLTLFCITLHPTVDCIIGELTNVKSDPKISAFVSKTTKKTIKQQYDVYVLQSCLFKLVRKFRLITFFFFADKTRKLHRFANNKTHSLNSIFESLKRIFKRVFA